jgi:multidrug efflux system outer membrane protein
MRTLLLILVTAALVGCAVGPDYREPEQKPAPFVGAQTANYNATSPEAQWWQQFGDPLLDNLVSQGLSANLDLKAAAARVAAARAIFTDQRLDQLPTVTSGAGYEHAKAQQPGLSDSRIETESYSLGFDAGWEIDLFGRVRRSVEAARADAESAQYQLRDVQVTVAAEVARNFFELRGAQQQIAVARRNLENQRETLRITQVRYEAGRGTELDLSSAQARFSQTEAGIPLLIALEQRSKHRLAVLLGRAPGQLEADLSPQPITPLVRQLAVGTPTDLLRRRPDVRAAERSLAASTARIGVATADLFPRLSLTGFVGYIAGNPGAIGESISKAWSVAPTLSWAAFDLGSVRAKMRAAEARSDESLAVYEQTVLRALEDTENAFVGYSQQQTRLASLMQQASASRRAAELARIQYREGVIDFLRLLDAEGTLLQAEDAVAQSETALQVSVVTIYKALGGGWSDSTAQVAQRN